MDKDPQAELLIEAVKRFREAEAGPMRDWYHSNMHRIAKKHGLMEFLGHLLGF